MGFSINNPFNSLLLPANPSKSPQTAKIDQLIDEQNNLRRNGSNVSILLDPNGELVSQNFNA